MLDGVNGNNHIGGKNQYTMQSLNIESGTRAASIFNKIDISDGTKNNSLTQDQVYKFKQEYLENMPEDEIKNAIGNKTFKKLNKSYLQNFINEDGTYNLNNLENSIFQVLNSCRIIDSKNDESKLICKTLKELTGENFNSKETIKILELIGYQQQNKKDLKFFG